MPQFTQVFFMFLLVLLPVVALIGRRTHVEAAGWRKWCTLGLRMLAALCLILALAGLRWRTQERVRTVLFLLDVSDSVPTLEKERAVGYINAAVDALRPTDEFGVVAFAEQAALRLPIRPKREQQRLSADILSDAAINHTATSLTDAVQLTISQQPAVRQVVLLSDGLENVGEVTPLLELLRAGRVEVFTVPLNPEREQEVWLRELNMPTQVRPGLAFDVVAVAEATSRTQATVRLYRNGTPVATQQVDLEPGQQRLAFQEQLIDEGGYEYRVEITPNADEIIENNLAYGYTQVFGAPRVLYVESDLDRTAPLKTVLEQASLGVEVVPPQHLRADLTALQYSQAVILSDVSADDLSAAQMDTLESYVRDVGKGLVVIGGANAFGPGGYRDTPLERVLPVEMTPPQQKRSLALMLVVDASGSMENYVGTDQKLQLAIEGVRAAVQSLDEEDVVGVIAFAAKIIKEIAPTTAHESVVSEVGGLRPGSGTQMYPALKRAYELLKPTDAQQKHIVLLSDGKSHGDFETLVPQIAADGIRISALAIGDAAQELMRQIGEEWGKGTYHYVSNLSQLPKILIDEVQPTQQYRIQEPFQPVVLAPDATILAGIPTFPKLYGYVATSEKEAAQVYLQSHQKHPILAAWHYGLGRAVAFTSDVKPGWGVDWIRWDHFGRFWGQVVGWVLPQSDADADFALHIVQGQGRAEVKLETLSVIPADHTFRARVAGPTQQSEAIELRRVSSTQYIGTFETPEAGVYLVTVQQQRTDAVVSALTRSHAVSYPREYAEFKINRPLLSEIAARTNGVFDPTPQQVAQDSGEGVEGFRPLAFALLTASVVLFMLEMLVRRFSLSSRFFGDVRAQLQTRRGTPTPSSPALARLSQRKVTATQAPVRLAQLGGFPGVSVAGRAATNSARRLLEVKQRLGRSRD